MLSLLPFGKDDSQIPQGVIVDFGSKGNGIDAKEFEFLHHSFSF